MASGVHSSGLQILRPKERLVESLYVFFADSDSLVLNADKSLEEFELVVHQALDRHNDLGGFRRELYGV